MKKILIIMLEAMCFALVIRSAPAFAGQIDEQFFLANQRYAEGKYEEAVSLYEKAIQSGTFSGPLYYNLGNAYFKLGRLGKCILNYERSRRLVPQDEDLLANLSFVESLLEQEQPKEYYRWYEWIIVTIRDLFPASDWVVSFLMAYNLLFSSLILALFVARIRKAALSFSWLVACLTILSLIFTSAKIFATVQSQEGVIVQRVAVVRYSPSPKGAIAFQLEEGMKAQVSYCEGDWCHIRLTQDKSGWVERQTIEEI